MGGVPCNILLYADDMVVLAPTWQSMQIILTLANEAVGGLDMAINVNKSVAMIFMPERHNRRLSCTFPDFKIGNESLAFVDSFKYIGHWISNDLYDDAHILKQMGLLYARTNFLIRKFGRCSISVKLCLFETYCINFYGIELWSKYRKTTLLRITALYVKCIKCFLTLSVWIVCMQCFKNWVCRHLIL